MKTDRFTFELPPELIAQEPASRREDSRLLVLDRHDGRVRHSRISDLADFVAPGTVMVLNDTRVQKRRLAARAAETGGRAELLLLEPRGQAGWVALMSKARRRVPGKAFLLPEGVRATVTGVEGELRVLEFEPPLDQAYLERHGQVPLPPYIRRPGTRTDEERYQTVYAQHAGSAAAPTAGLHLTSELLARLEARGVELCRVTLHVGAGTFLPIRTALVESHRMHEERYRIPESTAERVNRALGERRPVLAVGTTVVRTLESAGRHGRLEAGEGRTSLYIVPGFPFRMVSRLLTNFHTPRSTLLVLVCALAGTEAVLAAYREAVAARYRFFSYGDAMLIR